MKYVYLNESENKVVTISNKQEMLLLDDDNLTEYQVRDEFDLKKEVDDGNGNTFMLEGFLTATEFLERRNADYISRRVAEYPSIGDQLDALYKAGVFPKEMQDKIKTVKDNNPKG